jgi:uncharacterized protein
LNRRRPLARQEFRLTGDPAPHRHRRLRHPRWTGAVKALPIAFRVAILKLAVRRRLMADIESPCNKVCALDPIAALCVGCGRTLPEIEAWVRLSADERARIMAELPRRISTLGRMPVHRAGLG